jgi:hypothetical protein
MRPEQAQAIAAAGPTAEIGSRPKDTTKRGSRIAPVQSRVLAFFAHALRARPRALDTVPAGIGTRRPPSSALTKPHGA